MNVATLSGHLIKAATAPAYRSYLRSLDDPGAAQARLLRWIVRDSAGSAYGKHHDLRADDGAGAFREKLPIVNYEALRPWMQRAIFEEEPRVLSSHPIVRVEATSGSSSGVKWIPYTRPMMGTFGRMFTLWAHDLLSSYYRPKTGRLFMCVTGGPKEVRGPISQRHIGDDRDYLGKRWRGVLDRFVIAPRFAGTEDPLDRLSEILLRERKLELMSFWSPSLLLSVADHAGLTRPEETQRLWPHLQVISCWTAASSALFMDRLRALFPHARFQGKGLLATEAALTIPVEPAGGCVPLLDDVFLEFRAGDGSLLLLHELQAGEDYEVLMSNRSGLLRYQLGDRVRVSGFYHRTPILDFLGRAGVVSDLVGEKMTLEFVEQEVAPAIGAYFCLLPDDRGYQLWLDAGHRAEMSQLDELMCRNYQYRRALRLEQLAPLQVFEAEGLAEKIRRCLEGDEARSGSRAFKPPLMIANRAKAQQVIRELPRRLRENTE